MTKIIHIFDTTLRDGEQSPGVSLSVDEKLKIAKSLDALGVDVIEAGFPINSPNEAEAVRKISKEVTRPVICVLARAVKNDIDVAWNAVKEAKHPRIHTFVNASEIQIRSQLKKSSAEVLEMTREAVRYAKSFCDDVEFSPMDATRAEFEFLCSIIKVAINEGATVINIPDTVGACGVTPFTFYDLISRLFQETPELKNVTLSVHCHNDRNLATANAWAAILAGATQVECTVNGIGERSGNTALEEIVTIINDHPDWFSSMVDESKIYQVSMLVEYLTGYSLAPNKAIVGDNVFAHEAGIHADGILKDPKTFQDLDPSRFGRETQIVLGKHSGKGALRNWLLKMGITLEEDKFIKFFKRFQDLVVKQKIEVSDLVSLVAEFASIKDTYILVSFDAQVIKTANWKGFVKISNGKGLISGSAIGDGPIDAVCKAISDVMPNSMYIEESTFKIKPLKSINGSSAEGSVTVDMVINGEEFVGKAVSTDLVQAAACAYLDAINRMLILKN